MRRARRRTTKMNYRNQSSRSAKRRRVARCRDGAALRRFLGTSQSGDGHQTGVLQNRVRPRGPRQFVAVHLRHPQVDERNGRRMGVGRPRRGRPGVVDSCLIGRLQGGTKHGVVTQDQNPSPTAAATWSCRPLGDTRCVLEACTPGPFGVGPASIAPFIRRIFSCGSRTGRLGAMNPTRDSDAVLPAYTEHSRLTLVKAGNRLTASFDAVAGHRCPGRIWRTLPFLTARSSPKQPC
jgi:hypothetical protein